MRFMIGVLLLCTIVGTGCAPGQRVNYLGEYRFKPDVQVSETPTKVQVKDSRPEVLSGASSASNVGIMRSIAGVPWAIHTASGRPLAADVEESIVLTLHRHAWQNTFGAQKPSNIMPDLEIELNIKQWIQEVWFSAELSYCVEMTARVCGSKSDAVASQCGKRSISESMNLESAVGEIVGSLFNSPSMRTLLTSASHTPLNCKVL